MTKLAPKIFKNKTKNKYFIILSIIILVLTSLLFFYFIRQKKIETQNKITNTNLVTENQNLTKEVQQMNETITNINTEIDKLKNEDLRKTNQNITIEIQKLQNSFKNTVTSYEEILNLQDRGSNITSESSKFSSILSFLAKDDLVSAQKTIDALNIEINKEKTRLAALVAPPIPANVPDIKEAPSSGYRRQKVTVGDTSFLVDIVSADLNHTKVIVDTASDSTCTNNCPVLPLNTYVSRSGAYAGINGTYFCPDTYPSCVDKKNTFDVLVMNKNKVYFNSDNNVYSSVPVAIFSGSSARFIAQSSGWGRNTDVDAVIANRPLLVLDGNLMFGNGGEAKEIIKSSRGFLGSSGNIAYIGIVHNATVVESAKVLQTMGIKNAINLDDGGSAALWSGGYKVGPGRDLPNVVLFVSR